MALEPITRQEQIIAGKDLEPITRMEKFLKEYGGGGGASSWNDLDDRPFGEETVYGDTLTWDGNTEGRYMVDLDGLPLYLVSEATPTATDMANGLKFTDSHGSAMELQFEQVAHVLDNGIIGSEIFFVIPQDDCDFNGITFGKKGLYMVWVEGNNNMTSLTINGYNGFPATTVKPIDNKYLEPFETVGGDTLTWDGNTGGVEIIIDMYCKISDATPTAEDLANYNLTLNDGTTASNVDAPAIVENHGAILWDGAVQIIFEDTEVDGIPLKKGVYFYNDGEAYVTSLTINGYTGFTTTKLKEDCLPSAYMKTTFYNNTSDSYLYKDAGCTQKVASSELSEAIKGIVEIEIVIENAEYIVCTPVYMASYGTIGSVFISYGSVNYDGHKVMMSMALYTAEYAG